MVIQWIISHKTIDCKFKPNAGAFLLFYRKGHFPVSVTQGYRDQSNHHFQERIHFNSYIILSYNMYELKWIFNWKWWFNWSLYPWVTGMSQVGLVNTCVNLLKFWSLGFIPSDLNNQIWPRAIWIYFVNNNWLWL